MRLDTIVVFILNTLTGIIEALLGLRFFLKLLGASDAAPFVKWIYESAQSLLEPFSNMFPSPTLGIFIAEFTTIFAMIVYAVVGYFVVRLFQFVYDHIITSLQPVKSSPDHIEPPNKYMA